MHAFCRLQEDALKKASRCEDLMGGGATGDSPPALPVIPVMVVNQLSDKDGVAAVASHPRALPTDCETKSASHYVTPETHVAYAATWFALSLAAGIIGVVKFRGKRLSRRSSHVSSGVINSK